MVTAGSHDSVHRLPIAPPRCTPFRAVVAMLVVSSYAVVITMLRNTLSIETAVPRDMVLVLKDAHHVLDGANTTILAPQDEQLRKQCFVDLDYGLIAIMRAANVTYCTNATGIQGSLTATAPLSTYTHYYSPGTDLGSTVITNLWVDLRNASVFMPIHNISQDGHLHDPRFAHDSVHAYCVCNAAQDSTVRNGVPVWESLHGDHPAANITTRSKSTWTFCRAVTNSTYADFETLRAGVSATPWNRTMLQNKTKEQLAKLTPPLRGAGWPFKVHHVKTNAILIARRDDHNPFFQIAAALNAWIMMKVLDWAPDHTQLVYFDDGLPTLTDALQRDILSPRYPVVFGRDIMGSVLRFDRAMVAPFEVSGPMMRSLDGEEPCHRNALIQDFRDHAMARLKVTMAKKDPTSCTITIISRRPYEGRMVQRRWLNEDAIVERMRDDYTRNTTLYKYGTCRIQSLDFVTLSLAEQMRVVVESDVLVGMHGAGMVNVLWTRTGTIVAEIFPRKRLRWGYRNLCQFVGCEWHEFRGGNDTGTGDNASDKLISYSEWRGFFDPLVRRAVATLETRVGGLQP